MLRADTTQVTAGRAHEARFVLMDDIHINDATEVRKLTRGCEFRFGMVRPDCSVAKELQRMENEKQTQQFLFSYMACSLLTLVCCAIVDVLLCLSNVDAQTTGLEGIFMHPVA